MASKNPLPLSQYFQLYELAIAYEGKSQKTQTIYLSNLNPFLHFLQAKLERIPLLADLTPEAVMEYVASLKMIPCCEGHPFHPKQDQPISAHSLDQHVRTLKGFSTWLSERGYTRTNVLKPLPQPKVPSLTIEPMTDEEIKRVMASIDTRTPYGARNYAIIGTLLDTGLRSGELCNLKLDDIHLEGRHCYQKAFGKGQKERIVYLGRRALESLITYKTFVRPHHAKSCSPAASS